MFTAQPGRILETFVVVLHIALKTTTNGYVTTPANSLTWDIVSRKTRCPRASHFINNFTDSMNQAELLSKIGPDRRRRAYVIEAASGTGECTSWGIGGAKAV